MDWLTWLRYNAWLLLYPIGLFLEGIPLFSTIPILGVILVRSIPNYYYSGIYSLQLPNALNFSFNFGIFLGIFTVTCFPYSKESAINFYIVIFSSIHTSQAYASSETLKDGGAVQDDKEVRIILLTDLWIWEQHIISHSFYSSIDKYCINTSLL